MKKIKLELTKIEAEAIMAAVKACCDFNSDYYMFSPEPSYNEGNFKRNDQLLCAAVDVSARIDKQL